MSNSAFNEYVETKNEYLASKKMFKNYIAAKKEYLTLKQQRGGGNRNDEDDEFYSQYCSAKKNYLNLKQQFGGDDWHMKHIKEKIKYLENKKKTSN